MTVGEMSPHPSALPLLTPGMFLRTLRAKRSCTRRRVTVFSMSLRTSAHTGVAIRFPRREAWQVGCCLGKFVALSRIRLRRCFLLCATAGVTDCHVAPLLAMTCRNMQLPAVATAWCHGKFVTPYVCALSAAILLCPTAGEADCPVASLLAMTGRNLSACAQARGSGPLAGQKRGRLLVEAAPRALSTARAPGTAPRAIPGPIPAAGGPGHRHSPPRQRESARQWGCRDLCPWIRRLLSRRWRRG